MVYGGDVGFCWMILLFVIGWFLLFSIIVFLCFWFWLCCFLFFGVVWNECNNILVGWFMFKLLILRVFGNKMFNCFIKCVLLLFVLFFFVLGYGKRLYFCSVIWLVGFC